MLSIFEENWVSPRKTSEPPTAIIGRSNCVSPAGLYQFALASSARAMNATACPDALAPCS